MVTPGFLLLNIESQAKRERHVAVCGQGAGWGLHTHLGTFRQKALSDAFAQAIGAAGHDGHLQRNTRSGSKG